MDAATARDHWSRCSHRLHLQLPLPLSLISFCSLRLQWICNDRLGFWIRDGGSQVFKTAASAKCKSVRNPHANHPDTPVALTSASKYFHILPAPPGALQCVLRLCNSNLRCSWKHLHIWRYLYISNNPSFRLKHPGVPDNSDGSDGTSYPLTENYTLPVALHTHLHYYAPGIRTIRTTRVLHSSQGLQLCCSRLHNVWRCLCLSSADSHILPLRYCY